MAIGDTVQAGLMRIDTSAYERAGQANANANQAFGNALNQVAKGFIEGREKKARAEEMTGYLMNQGVSEKDAKAIAKNPFLQKEYQRKKGAEQQMKIEEGRIAQMAANRRSAQKIAGDKAAQIQSEKDLIRADADELKQSATNIAKFNLDRPDLPITEETPAAFLPELDPDPFVGPPTTYQGQAPAVAQLPESFQPQGAQVVDAVQSGRLSPLEGNRIMDSIQGQAMAERKAAPSLKDILDIQGKTLDMNIKTEDFEQKQDAISFKPEQNYLNLGEVKYGISGKFGNEAEVIKIKSEAIPNYQKMNEVMEDLIDLGEARKKQKYMSNSDKVLAESLSRQLQGLLREDILGPGTVTEPERAILEQIIQNPTQWFDFKGKTDDKIRSLKGVRKKAFNTLKSRLSGLGLDVSEFEQGGNASGTNKSSNMQNKTDSGLSFEEISLDDL